MKLWSFCPLFLFHSKKSFSQINSMEPWKQMKDFHSFPTSFSIQVKEVHTSQNKNHLNVMQIEYQNTRRLQCKWLLNLNQQRLLAKKVKAKNARAAFVGDCTKTRSHNMNRMNIASSTTLKFGSATHRIACASCFLGWSHSLIAFTSKKQIPSKWRKITVLLDKWNCSRRRFLHRIFSHGCSDDN